MYRTLLLSILLFSCLASTHAQVVINEAASNNPGLIADEDGDHPDWIELLNTGASPTNLAGWSLTDNNTWNKWMLPDITLDAGDRILVFASGKDRNAYSENEIPPTDHWETAIYEDNNWEYRIGASALPASWNTDLNNTLGWPSSPGGFGYGDNDDNTIVPDGTVSVYSRFVFNVADPSDIVESVLSIDYDDAFVAYINGVEIARVGLNGTVDNTSLATTDHEAAMYSGGDPEDFYMDYEAIQSLINAGENILAIEVHNIQNNSSDLSCRAWLHFGIGSAINYFDAIPSWFIPPVNGGNGSNLHTNFKISFGETIKLFNPLAEQQDLVVMNAQTGDSRARIPDGSTWCYTDTPTPHLVNATTCYIGYAPQPSIFPASGFYPSAVSVTMTGSSVRFSIDGDEPDTSDPFYASAIPVNASTVIRARGFQANKLPSAVASRTYFINDPTTLPVVSIIAHSGDLFDDGTGGPAVYDNSAGFQQSGTTGCTIQYFDASHNLQFESPASLTPVGNFSLAFSQKSMQFQFDEEYGATGDALYNIFSLDKPGLGPSHGFRVRNMDDDYSQARMRDIIANRMALPTHSGTAAYQNVSVYINGEYWGQYGAREMLNAYFMRDNYGAIPDEVDMVKTAYPGMDYVEEEGTTDSFFEMSDFIINTDMSDDSNFAAAQEIIDTENWIDYWADQIYNNNQDWFPSQYFNNTRLANCDATGLKWKYLLWDVGYSQGVGGGFDNDLLSNALAYPSVPNLHTDMMNSLLANNAFRNHFINRFADLLNWHWTTENIYGLIDECAAELAPEIDRQNDAWGSGNTGEWEDELDYLKEFHEYRPGYQRDHIENYFELDGQVNVTLNVLPAGAGYIQVSTIIPDEYPWTGIYFDGNPVRITAVANPGFTFDHWNTNPFITDVNSADFTTNISNNTLFTAHFTGIPVTPDVMITEINYHSDSSLDMGDWIEFYNNSDIAIDLTGWHFVGENFYDDYAFPPATLIEAHSYLVVCNDLQSFTAEHPEVINVIGEFDFALDDGGQSFTLTNVSGETIIAMTYDDGTAWPGAADGHGRTLERVPQSANASNGSSWFAGCMGGSPGVAFNPCNENPYVDEINYNSSATDNAGDWFEMHNNSASAFNIGNWIIADANDNEFILPANATIPANGYVVFYQDEALFESQFANVTNAYGPFVFGYSNSGDVIRIKDAEGRIFQSVCFDDVAPWPTTPDGGGYTLELNDSTDLNNGSHWFAGCLGGSPGYAYNPLCVNCNLFGCMDVTACNFNEAADCEDGSCTYGGCTNPVACNYNEDAGCDDGSCLLPGCTNVDACNYEEEAGCDDGSCTYGGCVDDSACNYDINAGCDDGSCEYPGCTNENACNYNPQAGCDDGSCTFNTFYLDNDGDGFGDPAITGQFCSAPSNYVADHTDCNDESDEMYPGAPGTAQNIDNNCNGVLDPFEVAGCPADLNQDGIITVHDLFILVGDMDCTSNCIADITQDTFTDINDLLFFMTVFGSVCP